MKKYFSILAMAVATLFCTELSAKDFGVSAGLGFGTYGQLNSVEIAKELKLIDFDAMLPYTDAEITTGLTYSFSAIYNFKNSEYSVAVNYLMQNSEIELSRANSVTAGDKESLTTNFYSVTLARQFTSWNNLVGNARAGLGLANMSADGRSTGSKGILQAGVTLDYFIISDLSLGASLDYLMQFDGFSFIVPRVNAAFYF